MAQIMTQAGEDFREQTCDFWNKDSLDDTWQQFDVVIRLVDVTTTAVVV